MRKEIEDKKAEKKELKKVKEEAFRAIGAIYIEPLSSRPPLVFWKSSESYGEEKNVQHEIFEALKHVATVGKGLEKTLRGSSKTISTSYTYICHK